jgi:hypothetical protein
MGLFDPGMVNRQIDGYLASVPPGKRVCLLGQANLLSKQASASIVLRVNDSIGAYVRVSKTLGGATEADAGVKIAFLYGGQAEVPADLTFTYPELVAVFKDRGMGWVRSHISAYKLLHGQEVEL